MTIEHDYFRPREAPASLLYDAFQEEAKHRKGRDVDEWIRLELEAVHRAAVTYAEQHGLHAPTMEQVAAAERYARGSADYGSKWALVLSQKMSAINNTER
ncbi:hypothetical protein [Acidovorax temperans]|uniref:hypothetical protein n=1 Tax=Acidovorax temperans TaxID=80878 RepID=UPI0023582391|nr:hypothetical protein [Acidovorax temperans]WCT26641.1 hypothetical protein PQV96_21735 [Acidovorax temperans]